MLVTLIVLNPQYVDGSYCLPADARPLAWGKADVGNEAPTCREAGIKTRVDGIPGIRFFQAPRLVSFLTTGVCYAKITLAFIS